jgi:chemotaxis protein methyltransferase CheR
MNDAAYELLRKRIKELLRIDISSYKPQQMRRRLDSYVARRATGTAEQFVRDLASDKDALDELRNMLTINVSEFFRDAEQFKRLEAEIFPELLRSKKGTLKVWSSACSHGEEPYSMAIILKELTALHRSEIVATDIDREVLARAKAGGPYNINEMRNVSPARLKQNFTEQAGSYTVADALRTRVSFREINLLEDPFTRGFDLIACRNVMIYFSDEAKQSLFQRFHDALAPGGVLFLGGTEALLGGGRELFTRVGGNFYRKPDEAALAA